MIPGVTASGGFISPLVTVTEGAVTDTWGYRSSATGMSAIGSIDVNSYLTVPILELTINAGVGGDRVFNMKFEGDVTGAFFSSVDIEGFGNHTRASMFFPNGSYNSGNNLTLFTKSMGTTSSNGWDGTGTRTVKINR